MQLLRPWRASRILCKKNIGGILLSSIDNYQGKQVSFQAPYILKGADVIYPSSQLPEEVLQFIKSFQLTPMWWLFQGYVKVAQALFYILQEVGHRPGLGGLPLMRE